ncbi:MAG: hypothetical protein JWM71_2080 [Solirubrobacteraceae bacterium]|nr:hypothetical protein [Solirubrobacteraceae bacterium]
MSLDRRSVAPLLAAIALFAALLAAAAWPALAASSGSRAHASGKVQLPARLVIAGHVSQVPHRHGHLQFRQVTFRASRHVRYLVAARKVRRAEVRVTTRRHTAVVKKITGKKIKKALAHGGLLTIALPAAVLPAASAGAAPVTSTTTSSGMLPTYPATTPQLVIEVAPAPAVTPPAVPDPPSSSTSDSPTSDTQLGCALSLSQLSLYVQGRRPPGCWRPYSADSPFNRPIGDNPVVAAGSSAIVSRLLGFGKLINMGAGDAGTDFDSGTPAYFSLPTDPVYTLHCSESWGVCPIEGLSVHIPDRAQPEGGSDHHLTVVDALTGWEYDLWDVQSKPSGGGRLVFGWGAKTRIDGDGLEKSAANAAGYGGMAGGIRAEELLAGKIDHALIIAVHCDSNKFVYPASGLGQACSDVGLSNTNAPAMGQRFQFDMPAAQIEALNVPDYEKTILKAFSQYGAYVSDTGGPWAIDTESGQVYASFSAPDQWVAYAKKIGATYYAPDHRYVLPLQNGVDWAKYLRVLDPCTANATC